MGEIQNAILNMIGSAQAAAGIGAIVNKQKQLDTSVKETGQKAEETKKEVEKVPGQAAAAASQGAQEGLGNITLKTPKGKLLKPFKMTASSLTSNSGLVSPIYTWNNWSNATENNISLKDVDPVKSRDAIMRAAAKNQETQTQKKTVGDTYGLLKGEFSAEDSLFPFNYEEGGKK